MLFITPTISGYLWVSFRARLLRKDLISELVIKMTRDSPVRWLCRMHMYLRPSVSIRSLSAFRSEAFMLDRIKFKISLSLPKLIHD